MHYRRLCSACLFVTSLAAYESAVAVTTNWNTNSTGSYTNAANWSAGVPTSVDTAIFNRNLNIEYGVTFPGRPIVSPLTREVAQLRVGTNTVSFSDSVNLNQLPAAFKIDAANTLLEDALIIGDTAGQVATLNSTLADFSASSITIGNAAGSTGTLNVNGGSLNITQTDHVGSHEFVIGKDGSGALNITNGGRVIVNGESRLGAHYVTASAAVSISGAGSRWQTGRLTDDSDNTPTITVQSGAELQADYVQLNDTTITVSGNSSRFIADQFFAARTTISNGAMAESTELSAYGSIIVDGFASTWTVSESVKIASHQSLPFAVRNGGQLIAPMTLQVGLPRPPGGGADFDGTLEIDGATSVVTVPTLAAGHDQYLNNPNLARGTVKLLNGGSVAGSVRVHNSGILTGTGSITNDVRNGGIVEPKMLHIGDDYTQELGGLLRFNLTGTTPGVDYGRLVIDGTGSFTGTLEVLRPFSYTPQPGDTFDLFDRQSGINFFSAVLIQGLPYPLSWDTTRLSSDGILRAILPGDYNENGTVDTADYVVWRERIGSNSSQTLPNDGTLGVGFDDYITWRANFGNTAPTSGFAAAIPEPSSALLACILAAFVAVSPRLCLGCALTNNNRWFPPRR